MSTRCSWSARWPTEWISAGGLLLGCLSVGCAAPEPERVHVVGPAEILRPQDVQLRIMETGLNVDLDRARRELARFFDAPLAAGLFEDRKLSLDDLPTPFGCAWLRVADEVRALRCLATPLGRLVLCRTDDGADLRLSDFERVAEDQVDGVAAVRLVVRSDRSRALEHLTRRAAGSTLLFVAFETVRLAASVDGPVEDDMLLVGLEAGPVQELLSGL